MRRTQLKETKTKKTKRKKEEKCQSIMEKIKKNQSMRTIPLLKYKLHITYTILHLTYKRIQTKQINIESQHLTQKMVKIITFNINGIKTNTKQKF